MAEVTERDWKEMHEERFYMSCGHPRGCLMQAEDGTAHCAWCEEVARLREELKRAISAREAIWSVPVKIHGTPCDKCGGTDYQCAECLENIAETDAEWWELREEIERLQELIPDAGMLNWLVKAAHRWWKDNGGEGTQKDIAAGYALVKNLYREANIDKE